ncbi:hypothetical protein DPMN_156625 [Dreissena polymorpha]|uniref:Uncharacterized protein n=1 Tax=Dreissena polymorpha TaxID=45954 RepID=A0A9D4JCJ2_DREPO|nr:hypothetical protein DPMN_156625 [Dreissena polymorpha]
MHSDPHLPIVVVPNGYPQQTEAGKAQQTEDDEEKTETWKFEPERVPLLTNTHLMRICIHRN